MLASRPRRKTSPASLLNSRSPGVKGVPGEVDRPPTSTSHSFENRIATHGDVVIIPAVTACRATRPTFSGLGCLPILMPSLAGPLVCTAILRLDETAIKRRAPGAAVMFGSMMHRTGARLKTHKKKRRPKGAANRFTVSVSEFFYAPFRRRRIRPNPARAVPRSASDAGSGTPPIITSLTTNSSTAGWVQHSV